MKLKTYKGQRKASISIVKTSEFYNACLVNDISQVRSYLSRMNIDEINRIEPNGSTALHTAAYHNHLGVVYLLLQHGAIGSIKNQYGLTPYEETTSSSIKQLLSSTGHAAWIEWTFADPPTREAKQLFDSALEMTFHTRSLSFILDYLLNHYARNHVAKKLPSVFNEIEPYFVNAHTYSNIIPVITAYTTPLHFDKVMNSHCIDVLPDLLRRNGNPKDTLSTSIFYLIAAFNLDPILRPEYAFTGRVYRGVHMSYDYIETYKIDELVVNRPFLSTSKRVDVADRFAGIGQAKQLRQAEFSKNFLEAAVRLTYQIRHLETRAINITNMSVFQHNEEEVLLMPLSVFKVIDIKYKANGSEVYITLEDCHLPSKEEPTPPIIRSDFMEIPHVSLLASGLQFMAINSTSINNQPISTNPTSWKEQVARSISNMPTKYVVMLIISIILLNVVVLAAILVPILLRTRSSNRNDACLNNGKCYCPALYTGTRYASRCTSSSNYCQNDGTCLFVENSYQCICSNGYTGEYCNIQLNTSNPIGCSNGGTYIAVSNGIGWICLCRTGYTGERCQQLIGDIIIGICASEPCLNGGTCIVVGSSYTCRCTPGYSGVRCQINILT